MTRCSGAAAPAGLLDGSSAAPPAPHPAPLRLLDGVCWCLTAAPHTALVPAGWRDSGGGSGGPQGGDPEPHAERGAEGLGWGPADSQAEGLGLGCGFTQAMEEELRGLAEDDLDACVFRVRAKGARVVCGRERVCRGTVRRQRDAHAERFCAKRSASFAVRPSCLLPAMRPGFRHHRPHPCPRTHPAATAGPPPDADIRELPA